MIKRIVYKLTENHGYWPMAQGLALGKEDLATLFETFDLHHDWMVVDKGPEEVIIWNVWDREDYPTDDDIPQLVMTRKSYDDVITVWNENIKNIKPYLVLMQDDTGLITMEAKNTLSENDLAAIEQDRKAGQEWEENWKKLSSENRFKKALRNLHDNIKRIWLRFRQWIKF